MSVCGVKISWEKMTIREKNLLGSVGWWVVINDLKKKNMFEIHQSRASYRRELPVASYMLLVH